MLYVQLQITNYKPLSIFIFQLSTLNSQLSIYQVYQRYRGTGRSHEVFMTATGLLAAMQAAVAFIARVQESDTEACLDAPTG